MMTLGTCARILFSAFSATQWFHCPVTGLTPHVGSFTFRGRKGARLTVTARSAVCDSNKGNVTRTRTESNTTNAESDAHIERETLDWIRRTVVGLNLCPFAAEPIRRNRLAVRIVRGTDAVEIADEILGEMLRLRDEAGTSVVVAPEFYPSDFRSYLRFVSDLKREMMVEHSLHGVVQVATFHPMFEYAGSGPEGVGNLIQRSPYPMFHILREDEVDRAVVSLRGDTSKVWQRNADLLKNMETKLGREYVERLMKCENVEGINITLFESGISGSLG